MHERTKVVDNLLMNNICYMAYIQRCKNNSEKQFPEKKFQDSHHTKKDHTQKKLSTTIFRLNSNKWAL